NSCITIEPNPKAGNQYFPEYGASVSAPADIADAIVPTGSTEHCLPAGCSCFRQKARLGKTRHELWRFAVRYAILDSSQGGFEWLGFYEITNLSKKHVTLTGFRVTWAPASFEGKHLRLVLRTNPSEVVLFNDENAVIDSVEGKAKDPSTTKFPVTIPPHATYFLRIHCIFDLLSGEKPLKFQDENDAHKWIAGAVGLPPGANGKVRCV